MICFIEKFLNFNADGYDDFNIKDIKPFFGDFFDYFIKFEKKGGHTTFNCQEHN